jgi:hypothetical protein
MARSGGLVTIVIALVCSAVLFATQWSSGGSPAGGKVDKSSPVERANAAAAQTAQVLAERELQAYQATHGTFAGAAVADISGVTVRSADATRYCLQVVSNGVALYDAGPDGTLSSTPCA